MFLKKDRAKEQEHHHDKEKRQCEHDWVEYYRDQKEPWPGADFNDQDRVSYQVCTKCHETKVLSVYEFILAEALKKKLSELEEQK